MTPERSQPIDIIPSQVFKSFNGLIAQNRDRTNGSSRVLKEEAVSLMVEKGLKREDIYQKHWLDNIEETYKKNGLNVQYIESDRDNEDFKPYFIFSPSKNKISVK